MTYSLLYYFTSFFAAFDNPQHSAERVTRAVSENGIHELNYENVGILLLFRTFHIVKGKVLRSVQKMKNVLKLV